MKRIQLTTILGLAGLLALPAPGRAATWRERSEDHFDLKGVQVLRVENARGEVEVRSGEPGGLRLQATRVSRASSRDHAKAIAADTQVETSREGDTFLVKVVYPQKNPIRVGLFDLLSGYDPPRAEVQLALEIPADLVVQCRTASGDISTTGLAGAQTIGAASGEVAVSGATGPVEVSTASGDVKMRDVAGATVRTVSGDITIDGATGPLSAKATSGSVTLRGARDSVAVQSVSGDILVDQAPHGIQASTASGAIRVSGAADRVSLSSGSGDVHVELTRPLQDVDVSTVSGDISGRLLSGVGCRLTARTSGGEIDIRVPLELKSASRREVVGVIGRGSTPVQLRTSAGDIELQGGGN